MEHLCIGSYVRILTSCAIPAASKFDVFCEKIMLALCDEGALVFSYVSADGNTVTYSPANFSKIHLSSQNLPTEVMNMAINKEPRDIERYFRKEVISRLDEGRKKIAVMALKNIILKDKDIPDATQLGTIAALTKENLKEKNDFVLAEFLTDIFIFAVAKTENMKEQAFTKSIKKDFYTVYTSVADTITLYEVTKPKTITTIPITSVGKFDRIFTSVSSEILKISSKNDLQIFCLKFDDFDFDYDGLWRYLRNNIGYYVYSRSQIDKYVRDEELPSLAYDAIGYLKDAIVAGNMPTGDELGEILLYIFLEQVLKAPKLMSKVEIQTHGGSITSQSAGIHLLTEDAAMPFNQIILGISMIEDDLNEAIDSVFAQAKELKDRKKMERGFVEANIFSKSFPDKMAKLLESIILPSESERSKPTTAYGMFLGYSLSGVAKSGKSVEDYQKAVIDQVRRDVAKSVSYIESKIAECGLEGFSVYIYLLPLSNAVQDKKDIYYKLLQIGGGEV